MRVLVCCLLAALALAAWLVLRSGPGRGESDAPLSAPTVEAADSSAATETALRPAKEIAADEPSPEVEAARESVALPELPVAGRVEVAGGIPLADEPVVVARAHRAGVSRLHSKSVEARVARDGSFELAVPAGTRSVTLELRSLLLSLPEEVEAPPGARDVVLRPRVQAAVRGRVHLPATLALGPSSKEPSVRISCARQGSVSADRLGAFELVVDAEQPLELLAETERSEFEGDAPPRAEARLALDALRAGEVRDVELFLRPWTTLRGVVVTPEGAPIENAWVGVPEMEQEPTLPEPDPNHTGPDGRFVLAVPPGTWRIEASARSRFQTSRTLTLPDEAPEELRFVLESAAIVSGRVLSPDGAPCTRAIVLDVGRGPTLVSATGKENGVSRLAFRVDDRWMEAGEAQFQTTDADGRFTLELDAPRVRLTASAPALAPATPLELELAPGRRVDDVVLRLRPECRLRGKALDENGLAVRSNLRFEADDGLEIEVPLRGGKFDLRQLPPGPARLACVDERLAGSVEIVLDPDRATEVELHLKGRVPR